MAVIQDIIAGSGNTTLPRWRILILLALFTCHVCHAVFRKRPAARLIFASDSLLILAGALIAQGVMDFLLRLRF